MEEKEVFLHSCWKCKLVVAVALSREVSQKLKLELLYDPSILLYIYLYYQYIPKGISLYSTDTCIRMFTAAKLTGCKIQSQPQCTSDEWIKKMHFTHTMKYYSGAKRNYILLIAGKLDGTGYHHAEQQRSNRGKY